MSTYVFILTRNISDGAVTGDKIANSTIKASSVDWATSAALPPATFSGSRSNNNASYQDLSGTYEIPDDGLYELKTEVWAGFAGGTAYSLNVRAYLDSEELFKREGVVSVPNYAGNQNTDVDITLSFYAKKGQTIKLQTKIDEAKFTGSTSHKCRVKRLV